MGRDTRLTDQFGVLLRILVVSTERVLEALSQLPQWLLLRLPRHGDMRELFAVRGRNEVAATGCVVTAIWGRGKRAAGKLWEARRVGRRSGVLWLYWCGA